MGTAISLNKERKELGKWVKRVSCSLHWKCRGVAKGELTCNLVSTAIQFVWMELQRVDCDSPRELTNDQNTHLILRFCNEKNTPNSSPTNPPHSHPSVFNSQGREMLGRIPCARTPTSSSCSRSSCATRAISRLICILILPKVPLLVAIGGGGHFLFHWV